MDRYALWSPHRESESVQAFRSLLRLRSENWRWVEEPAAASWLVIDAGHRFDARWTALLNEGGRQRQGIVLARSWAELPSPRWTYFKLPLAPKRLFSWIDQVIGADSASWLTSLGRGDEAAACEWDGSRLRLTRWPNLSAYGAQALQLLAVTQLMLSDTVDYEFLLTQIGDAALLNRFLDEMRAQRILIVDRQYSGPLPGMAPALNDDDGVVRGGATVTGLLQKFLRRFL